MNSFLQDLRYAFRQVLRAPWLSVTIIVVLALGIGVSAAALAYARGVATIPALGVAPDPRLVRASVLDAGRGQTRERQVSYANFIRLRERADAFESFAAEGYPRALAVDAGRGAEAVPVFGVTEDYFRTLRLRPAVGTLLPQVRDDDGIAEQTAVISYAMWRARFAQSPGVVGQRIAINGASFTITGVAPDRFRGITPSRGRGLAVWIPLAATRALLRTAADTGVHRDSLQLAGFFGRLRDGVSADNAQRTFVAVAAATLRSDDTASHRVSGWVAPMRVGVYGPRSRGGDEAFAGVVLGFVALLLMIITCTNVSALLLGRAAARRHEIAVRYSLGASRARVVRQLLTENVVLAGFATVLALGVLLVVRNAVLGATINDTPIQLPLDWITVTLSFGIAVVTGVLFGTSPALHATRTELADAVKQGAWTSDRKRTRAQRGMIAAQLAVSQPVLLAMALALGVAVAQRPWSSTFDKAENVLGVSVDFGARLYTADNANAFVRSLRERIAALPGVERTEITEEVRSVFERARTSQAMVSVEPEGGAGGPPPVTRGARLSATEVNRVGVDYFATLGLPIVRGRAFVASDTIAASGEISIIVDESVAAAFWPGQDPIGKRLVPPADARFDAPTRRNSTAHRVIGVVQTPRTALPNERPSMYLAGRIDALRGVVVLARTRVPAAGLFPSVQRAVQALDPDIPILELATAAQGERANLGTAGRIAAVATFLGGLALGLVSLGLAGIVMFAVAERTREIGVRVALGAQRGQVIGLFVRNGLRTAVLGFAIGIPLSIGVFVLAMKSMYSASIAVNGTSALIAAGVLFGVVLAASWLPARRAARVDPLVALRAE